jgi:hypothetical protein
MSTDTRAETTSVRVFHRPNWIPSTPLMYRDDGSCPVDGGFGVRLNSSRATHRSTA